MLSSLLPLTERGYLLNMSRLFDALDERFDDIEEVKDVYNHGCGGGVGGFIYYSETRAFFFEHEDEIEDYVSQIYGDQILKEIATTNTSINQMINQMVWMVVEDYCACRWGKHEHAQLASA